MKHDGRLKDFCVDAENNQQYIISVKRICYPQCTRGTRVPLYTEGSNKRDYFEVGNGSRRTLKKSA